jgi:hypothetical protein
MSRSCLCYAPYRSFRSQVRSGPVHTTQFRAPGDLSVLSYPQVAIEAGIEDFSSGSCDGPPLLRLQMPERTCTVLVLYVYSNPRIEYDAGAEAGGRLSMKIGAMTLPRQEQPQFIKILSTKKNSHPIPSHPIPSRPLRFSFPPFPPALKTFLLVVALGSGDRNRILHKLSHLAVGEPGNVPAAFPTTAAIWAASESGQVEVECKSLYATNPRQSPVSFRHPDALVALLLYCVWPARHQVGCRCLSAQTTASKKKRKSKTSRRTDHRRSAPPNRIPSFGSQKPSLPSLRQRIIPFPEHFATPELICHYH